MTARIPSTPRHLRVHPRQKNLTFIAMKHSHLILPIATLAASLLFSTPVSAQDSPPGTYTASPKVLAGIAAATPPDRAVAPLIYLADDRLKGRYIGRPEIDIAGDYIASQFREAGARPLPGTTQPLAGAQPLTQPLP